MKQITDFGLDSKKCVVCGEDLFLDHSGNYYICKNGCRRIKNTTKE